MARRPDTRRRRATILTTVLDRPDAVLVWVVFVVGVHFLPVAHAFGLPVFRWLSASLVVVSVVGAVPVPTSDSAVAAGRTAAAAGSCSCPSPQWDRA